MSKTSFEPVWHVELAVIVAIILQFSLAAPLSAMPRYLLAGLELMLLIGLHFGESTLKEQLDNSRRLISLLLTSVVSIANIASLWLVINYLLRGSVHLTGQQLIISAVSIFITNLVTFGLWYWLLDGGGPGGRGTHKAPVDFLFPQMNTPESVTKAPDWRPSFVDYLYISMTNGTAFSPTDALPLTHRAKLLMGVQAITSLLTVVIVAAHAINTLN